MPIIPLITRSSPLAPAAAPVLDRERRPTVDTRGQQQAVGNLAKAGTMPDVPMSLAEPYSALGAVGRAVHQGGDVVTALALKRQEAESDIQIATVDSEMQQERAQFEVWKTETNADPSTWDKEWDTRLQALQTRVGERTDLHPGAREAIGARMITYSGASRSAVAESATKETFGRAKSVFIAALDSATEAQNAEKFEEALTTAANKGYLFPHEIERARQRYKTVGEQKAKEAKADAAAAKFETNFGQLTEDPDSWLGTNKEPWKGEDAVMWQKLHNAAEARKREVTGEALGSLAEAIAEGNTIRSEADIDAWKSKGLTAVHREAAKRDWVSQHDFNAKRDRDANGPVNAVSLRQKAADYDPAKDPDGLEFFKLKQELVRTVPEGMREGVIDSADAKFFGRAVPQPKEIDGMVNSILGRTFHPIHGAFQWRRMEWQEQWERDPDTGQEVKKWRQNTVDDPAVMQRAFEEEARVRMRLQQWTKENPDDARNPEKVSKKLSELAEQGDAAAAMDAAIKSNMQQSAPQSGFRSKGTGYFPVDPGHKDYKMEGGRVGAAEWHGKPIKQEPLYTLDDFREGKAPYVSVAMDNSKKNPLEYGTILRSPQFPGVPFRVMDTGSAFNGKTQKYGPAKGLSKIDIARRDSRGANSAENNRQIDFEVWDDYDTNRIATR